MLKKTGFSSMENEMRRYWIFGLLLALGLLACGKKDETWLVKVKEQTLREDLFTRRYKMSREYSQHPVITPEIVRQFIEKNLLNNLYFQAEGAALKLEQDSTLAAQITQEERRMLTRNGGPLFKAVIPASFPVSSEEVQAAYEWGKQECKLSHILVKSPSLADSIYKALMAGADFPAMVKKYSMDVNTLETKGQIGPYLTWSNLAPAAAAAVRNTAVGSYTRPVLTGYGYQILRVDERRERKQPPFEQARAQIEGDLRNQKQGLFIESYADSLNRKFHLKVDSLLFVRIAPALNAGKPEVKVDYALITPEDQRKILVSYDGTTLSVREILDKYIQMTRGNAYRLSRYEDMVDFAKKSSLQDLMLLDARARKLDQSPEFKADFLYAKNQFIGQKCRERLVTRAVKVQDAEITAYYEAHKEEYKNQSLDQLRSTIRGRLYSEKTLQLQDKVTAELIKKYPVKWNDKALKKTAEALNAEKAKNPPAPGAPRGMGQMPGQGGRMQGQPPMQRPGQGPDGEQRPGQRPDHQPPAPPQGVR